MEENHSVNENNMANFQAIGATRQASENSRQALDQAIKSGDQNAVNAAQETHDANLTAEQEASRNAPQLQQLQSIRPTGINSNSPAPAIQRP